MTNDEVIETLKDMEDYIAIDKFGDRDIHEAVYLASNALENERPHGKWIIHQLGLLLTSECDNCHCQIGTINMNYCPNCGADMREADNV